MPVRFVGEAGLNGESRLSANECLARSYIHALRFHQKRYSGKLGEVGSWLEADFTLEAFWKSANPQLADDISGGGVPCGRQRGSLQQTGSMNSRSRRRGVIVAPVSRR